MTGLSVASSTSVSCSFTAFMSVRHKPQALGRHGEPFDLRRVAVEKCNGRVARAGQPGEVRPPQDVQVLPSQCDKHRVLLF